MSNVFHFRPKHELDAERNCNDFVERCKSKLTVFGNDLDWDDNYWKSAGMAFGVFGSRATRSGKLRSEPMAQPYLDFGKAYIRYTYGHTPKKSKQTLTAVKAIELALRELTDEANPKDINNRVFDHAADICKKAFTPKSAFAIGRCLEGFSQFISDNNLSSGSLDWKNRISCPKSKVQTGEKARKRREKKLPNMTLLDAIGDIFSLDSKDPRDILTTSTVALLMSAPSRISEVLGLSVDCELEEKKKSGEIAYGWRFYPGKNAPPTTKWIPSVFETVAKESIQRLTKASQGAREAAKWYEEHPDLFYRHENCPALGEDEELTHNQACDALGLSHHRGSLIQVGIKGGPSTLRSLRQWVNERLPRDFPWFDKGREIKYSDALYCSFKHHLRSDFNTSPVLLANPYSRQQFNHDLVSGAGNPNCLFSRHDVRDEGGKGLKISSHQMRHLLNTMCQKGGLPQYDIARWSGRVDVRINRDYDHMSEFELVDLVKKGDPSLRVFGPLGEVAKNLPMTQQEFNALIIPTAHITEFGFCVHDYVMQGCQKFRDCINCTEHVYIKGSCKGVKKLKSRYKAVKRLKQNAETEMAEGTYGADRFYEIQVLTEKRMGQVIAILEDPNIEDGAIVKLRNEKEFSSFKIAEEQRRLSKDGPVTKPTAS